MTSLDTNSPAAQKNYVDRLPAKLLVQVFLTAYFNAEQYDRFYLPFYLCGVTSRWRQIVLDEPRHWTYTFYGNGYFRPQPVLPIETTSLQLMLSKDRLLEIEIELRQWSTDDKIIDDVITMLLQHRNRWVAFSLRVTLNDGHVGLANSVLPLLSSVTVADIRLGWNDWNAVLCHGSKLVELEVRDVVIVRDGEGVLATRPSPALEQLGDDGIDSRTGCHPPNFLRSERTHPSHRFSQHRYRSSAEVWLDKPLPGLKTLMILNRGGLDHIRGVFERCRHVSHISICNDCVEGPDAAMQVLESLADPTTGPLLDQLATLTLTMVIPTFEGWERSFLGKKLQVYLHHSQENALRKFMDGEDFRKRGVILEKLKAVVPLEVCEPTRDDTWFGIKWRFGWDNE
ncbi:hypothetical protein FS837_011681 [Tulasnella sp. UAMH 9824]|nr:hypothetical protein FS837_011681 [Tulasnella sp. UAMH 9824]